MDEQISDDERLVRRFMDRLWADRDVTAIDDLVATDVRIANPAFGVELRGIDAFRDLAERNLTAFPDLETTIHRLVAADGTVVVQWTVRGTHRGPFLGIDPTGETIEFPSVSIYTVEDGRITEYWALSDSLGVMRQVGAIPSPAG